MHIYITNRFINYLSCHPDDIVHGHELSGPDAAKRNVMMITYGGMVCQPDEILRYPDDITTSSGLFSVSSYVIQMTYWTGKKSCS